MVAQLVALIHASRVQIPLEADIQMYLFVQILVYMS